MRFMKAEITAAVLLCVTGSIVPAPALAQSGGPARTPAIEAALKQARRLSAAFNYAAQRISPSVVHITEYSNVQTMRNWFEPPSLELQPTGAGSGVIVSSDGYVLTNHHVIAGAEKVRVKLSDGREIEGRIIGSDPATDLGVVKIEASDLKAADWGDAEALDVGEWVLAVGSPFGQYDNTVTAGIVSAKNRTNLQGLAVDKYEDFIQTDAAINPGNSGGPLVDVEGRIVGINSQIATRGIAQSAGIGFSIPATIARPVMESIIKTGRAQRGWAGLAPKALPSGEDMRRDGGVVIGEIVRGGPADKAGLRSDDVVTRINGRPVENWNRLRNAIAFAAPGSSAEFEIRRGSETRTVSVSVADRADALTMAEGGRAYKQFGFTVATLTKELRRRLNVRDLEGVVVTQVEPMSPAGQNPVALQPGDIIVAVNRSPTPDATQFDRVIEDLRRDSLRLNVIRGNQRGFIDLKARAEGE